ALASTCQQYRLPRTTQHRSLIDRFDDPGSSTRRCVRTAFLPTHWRFGAQRGATRACEPRTAYPGGADSAFPPAYQVMPLSRPTRLPSGSVNCASEIAVPGIVIGGDASLPPSCVA